MAALMKVILKQLTVSACKFEIKFSNREKKLKLALFYK